MGDKPTLSFTERVESWKGINGAVSYLVDNDLIGRPTTPEPRHLAAARRDKYLATQSPEAREKALAVAAERQKKPAAPFRMG